MPIHNGRRGMILLKMKDIGKRYNFKFVSSKENYNVQHSFSLSNISELLSRIILYRNHILVSTHLKTFMIHYLYMYHAHWTGKEEFEDTKELIRIHNSKKGRQL
jgi:hypothetical protein